jgi:hypothetical protein
MKKFKLKLNSDELNLLETAIARAIGKRKAYKLSTMEYTKLLLKIDKQILKQLEDGTSSE